MERNRNRHPRPAGITTLLAVFATATLAGCANTPKTDTSAKEAEGPTPPADAPPVPDQNEIALDNGTEVIAETPSGEITIIAGPGLLRTLKWDGATRWAVMEPRKERWAGSLGIHYDGTPTDWRPHQGLRKLQYEEGQRQFETMNDAKIWMQIRRMHYVHTKNGLVIGWKRDYDASTLQVEVWQFYVDGSKPSYMPGAEGQLIEMNQRPLRAADRD